jgi:hypothetical protein
VALIARQAPHYAWVFFAALAAIGYGINWLVVPHAREGLTLPEFIVKIIIFLLAVAAVASLPRAICEAKYSFLLLALPTLAFLGYIIPRMYYYFVMGPSYEPQYYTLLWNLCYPGIVLSICLGYRMGGGTFGRTFKIGANSLILLFSGYLEYMWFVVNPMPYESMATIPHIEVLIGFKPSHSGLLLFFAFHIPLLVILNMLPIDRWISRWSPSGRREPVAQGS